MVTLNKISEQVRRLYARSVGEREDIKPIAEEREVKLFIIQATHEILSVEQKQTIKLGDINIPTCMIATYTDIPVVDLTTSWYSTLPAYPINLPQDMGVWSVSPATGSAFIPITTAAWDLLGSLDEGLLENQTGFYVEGRKIFYTKATTGPVKVKLLIVDPALLGENDPWPINPEYEATVIARALELLTGIPQQRVEVKHTKG